MVSRVLLLCPDALTPRVRCVEDSLRARGYSVWVQQGRQARRWVRKAPPGPPTLRVLCVTDIEPQLAQTLRRGLDRDGRDDFHIVGLTIPRTAVEQIERLAGRQPRPRGPARRILAHPTLIEQQLDAQRRWRVPAAAAAALFAVGTLGAAALGSSDDAAVTTARPEPTVPVLDTRAPRRTPIDEPILSAVRRVDPASLPIDDDTDDDDQPRSSIVPSR